MLIKAACCFILLAISGNIKIKNEWGRLGKKTAALKE